MKNKTVPVSISMLPDFREELRKVAYSKMQTVSAYVVEILRKEIESEYVGNIKSSD